MSIFFSKFAALLKHIFVYILDNQAFNVRKGKGN